MTVHVLLPVHQRVAVTRRFARQLRAQRGVSLHLVLIDDGCTDGTVDAVREEFGGSEQLTVLHGNGDLWWGGSLQLGYEHLSGRSFADGDAVLIINDDVDMDPDCVATGLSLLAARPRSAWQAIGVDRVTGRIERGAVVDMKRLQIRAAMPAERPNCLSTRGLLMTARAFRESSGFRPRWLPHYLSDYEFTLRLAREGISLEVDERFRIGVDSSLTGACDFPRTGVAALWRSAMSHRSKRNPKHWSAFALIACPPPFGIYHAAMVWLRFGRAVFEAALRPARPR